MRKVLATAFAGTLLLASMTVSAQAATPKAGAACAKAGITQVVKAGTKTTKFTCVKSGKKTVWNKGVVTIAKPAPTPTPTQTQEPSPTPTPSATPTPTPTATAPEKPISLDNLDPVWTSRIALEKIKAKLASLPETNLAPEIIASSNTSKTEIDVEKRLLSNAMKMFQEYFAPTKFQVVMFTNLDGAWADQALVTYGGSFPGKVSDEITKQSTNGRYCSFAFATENRSTRVPVYYDCTDTRMLRDWPNFQTPPHEYFHLVHAAVAPVRTPVWLFEGSASFFGEMLGYLDSNTVERKLQQGFNTGRGFDPDNVGFDHNRFSNWLKTATATDVTKIFKILETEPTRPRESYAHYSLGSWATEALVATYGVDGYMKLWKNLGAGMTFEIAFKSAFNLTPDEFYVKLTPYLNSRVDPGLK